MRYNVDMIETINYRFEVEADSQEQAEERAEELLSETSIDNNCGYTARIEKTTEVQI